MRKATKVTLLWSHQPYAQSSGWWKQTQIADEAVAISDLQCPTPSCVCAVCGCRLLCVTAALWLVHAKVLCWALLQCEVLKTQKRDFVRVKYSKPPKVHHVSVVHVLLSCRHNCSRNTCSQWRRQKRTANRKQKNRLPEYNVLLRAWGHLKRVNKAS